MGKIVKIYQLKKISITEDRIVENFFTYPDSTQQDRDEKFTQKKNSRKMNKNLLTFLLKRILKFCQRIWILERKLWS